jgi:hypothetical protein
VVGDGRTVKALEVGEHAGACRDGVRGARGVEEAKVEVGGEVPKWESRRSCLRGDALRTDAAVVRGSLAGRAGRVLKHSGAPDFFA